MLLFHRLLKAVFLQKNTQKSSACIQEVQHSFKSPCLDDLRSSALTVLDLPLLILKQFNSNIEESMSLEGQIYF